MKTNKAAVIALREEGFGFSTAAVEILVNAGILPADPETEVKLSEPERIAQAAKDWVGDSPAYAFASGWSTQSWETVLGEKDIQHNIRKLKDVFLATVILAKEAGVEL